ncbi:PHP domain-containing protein [Kineosporia sp. A_224]|uniref:PHP domain-containing protein n=1 Tax=Kineosporia sp. A_224 TaxID=1962180 RepID=UPI000B4AC2AB|nr:PHP domain-containing protein [Kineosporia sp. A_224]
MSSSPSPRDPVADLRRIAFLLERSLQSSYKVKAFRGASTAIAVLPAGRLEEAVARGELTALKGVGDSTAKVITASLRGEEPEYLARLEREVGGPLVEGGGTLRAALRGDLHCHSDWSDGGSPIEDMAVTALELGHEYTALTDHSPRLTVARGLTAERLRRQLDVVARLNEQLAPFRLLTGIEVDILDDGSLDQTEDLLAELDVVVASVHSKLQMEPAAMTRRMVAAVSNPHVDILGHCTGRYVTTNTRTGKPRAESRFDAEKVFSACVEHGVAVEINSRPERLDPPRRLLRQAVEAGCIFSVDTDAHAPGQLDWQPYGCARGEECGVTADRVVSAWALDDLLAWTADHAVRPA